MNLTVNNSGLFTVNDSYIVCLLSVGFSLLSVLISINIIIVIRRSKPQLHTIRHLLISNTCIASIVYCIIQTINYIFLFFLPWITSDLACRWRGYLSYISIAMASYSYLIQTISRLFFSVLSTQYPWLTTFKAHYFLISIQWIFAFIVPLSTIITNDIYFRPGRLCWVPKESFIHLMYTFVSCYGGPILAVLIIYIYIYNHVQNLTKQTKHTRNRFNGDRDLKVLRNIVILLTIYIAGGTPILLYLITNIPFLYSFGIVTFTAVIFIEKLCTIGFDRELRSEVKNLIFLKNRVTPFNEDITQFRYRQNETRF